MSGQLIISISSKYICSLLNQIFYDVKIVAMGRQVERSPLLNSSCEIDIEFLHLFLLEKIVKLNYCLNSFILTLSDCKVQRRPVVVVLYVYLCSAHYQYFCYIGTFLRIFRENIHDLMEWGVSITVYLINISILLNQRSNNPNLELYYS